MWPVQSELRCAVSVNYASDFKDGGHGGGGDVKTSKFFILITIEIFWIYLIIP